MLLALTSVLWTGCRSTQPHTINGPHDAARRYLCQQASGPIVIDGFFDEFSWRRADSLGFVDIRSPDGPEPRFATHAWMLWDQDHLYVAAALLDPNVRGSRRQRDDVVYYDNDFEVFLDPDGDARNYVEIEVNALNTVFDLLLVETYRNGGPARHDWNMDGLRTDVRVDGTLNDASDVDRGWFVEMAIPWSALAPYADRPCPPRVGDAWRINFSRVQWPDDSPGGSADQAGKGIEDNWVWSPQGVVDMHIPQRWGLVEFGADARSLRDRPRVDTPTGAIRRVGNCP